MKKKILVALVIIAALCGLIFLISQTLLNFGRDLLTAPTPIIDHDHPLIDESFISGEPCEPPCWYGLIPGQSSFEDVNQVLSELEFMQPTSINILKSTSEYYGVEDIRIYFQCQYYSGIPSCGSLWLLGDTLHWIRHEIAYELSINEAVGIIGEPDLIILRGRRDRGCNVDFTWVEKGIIATHKGMSDTACAAVLEAKGGVPPDILISRIIYSAEDKPISCEQNCFEWQGMLDEVDD
jgi:hypothetical protein